MILRLLSFLAAGAAAAGALIVWASPVRANDCGGRCYTTAWQDGAQLAGVQATWDLQELGASDWPAGGFALQDLWAINANAPLEWVEVGYRRGWQGTNWTGYFWAEFIPGWGQEYYEYQVTLPLPGAVGSRHNFVINYIGNAGNGSHIFGVYIDGQCVQAAQGCESWHWPWIVTHQVGSEATQWGSVVGPTH